ncbi:MAG: hypothetical protein GYB55_22680 [Cytophagales bacterium]|uniref:hypothetical protein n=1 Tax=Cyclobacterium marinum TaxID=104 RepID=UPI0030DC1043|nr:hypothetical protein [Cytophagales bacterium]|tara:strand:+ start:14687 stop:16036 length:1350 start_codon:yes stop_codon:yes gene_type:complete
MKETCLSLLFTYLLVFSIAAQVPNKGPVPLPTNGLLHQPPTTSLIRKPLPFKEEIRQIQSIKKAYDSLNREIRKLQESKIDSIQKDSLVNGLKIRGIKIIEHEKAMLLGLSSQTSPSSQQLKNSAIYLLSQVEKSQAAMHEAKDMVAIEKIIRQNEENLKAIFNEQLMPELEQKLGVPLSNQIKPTGATTMDYYGKGAVEELVREKISPTLTMAKAQTMVKEKSKGITNEYLRNIGNNYSKISMDSLGNIQVAEAKKSVKKFNLRESKSLKNAPFVNRTGLYFWYDPLTSFAEGIFIDLGIKYSINSQWHPYAGIIAKRQFKSQIGPVSTGEGIKGGLRFTLGKWMVQGELARSRLSVAYAPGYEHKNFDGVIWISGLGAGRSIPIGKRLQSVFFLTWDPLFKESRSISTSRFQLKIGFELNQLKKIMEEVPKNLIPTIPRPKATSEGM